MLRDPESIGRFEVIRRLGEGGMGVLYLARDPLLGRTLAVKMLSVLTSDLRERFSREARAAATLKHPNIITIHDVGEDHGRPFIAMEYVDGPTLAELIARNAPMDLGRKIELMIALCEGLAHAHRWGVIHRDVKPANLMIGSDNTLRILDFGLARSSSEAAAAGLTQTGVVLGTPHYMAPEQIEARPVDHRGDVFSVGLVCYELLSYRRAYPGDSSHKVMSQILSARPQPLNEVVEGIDPELQQIVERAIEHEPERRYQKLSEMADALAQVLQRLRATGVVEGTSVGPEVTIAIPSRAPSSDHALTVARTMAIDDVVMRPTSGVSAPALPPVPERSTRTNVAVGALVVVALFAGAGGALWFVEHRADVNDVDGSDAGREVAAATVSARPPEQGATPDATGLQPQSPITVPPAAVPNMPLTGTSTEAPRDSAAATESRVAAALPPNAESTRAVAEATMWKAVEANNRPEDYQSYLTAYPRGQFAAIATERKARLERAAEETALWQKVEAARDLRLFESFVEKYPTGPHTDAARSWITDLRAAEARQEAARVEAARQDAARQEAARQEAARQEAARAEVVRQEQAAAAAASAAAARAAAPVDLAGTTWEYKVRITDTRGRYQSDATFPVRFDSGGGGQALWDTPSFRLKWTRVGNDLLLDIWEKRTCAQHYRAKIDGTRQTGDYNNSGSGCFKYLKGTFEATLVR